MWERECFESMGPTEVWAASVPGQECKWWGMRGCFEVGGSGGHWLWLGLMWAFRGWRTEGAGQAYLCSVCTFTPGAEWLAGSTGSYLGPGYTVPPWVTEACHMHRVPPGEILLLIPGLKQLSRKNLSPSRIGSHGISLSSFLAFQRSSYFLSWSSPWLSQWLSLYCILGWNFFNYDFLFLLPRRESKGSIPFTLVSIGNRYPGWLSKQLYSPPIYY